MNLARALSQSCDTIFYPMGYEYWRLYYPPPSLDGIEGNDDEAPKSRSRRTCARSASAR